MEVDQQQSTSPESSRVVQLLNQGDQLTQRFQKQFNDSITHVQALHSATQQHENLSKLVTRAGGSEIESQYPTVRQRTLDTLAQTMEESARGIRSSLEQMETTVDALSELLYQIDIYLAEPSSLPSHGFNPNNALKHLGNLFDAYQAELLAKRELFFAFNSDELPLDQFVRQWQICNHIKSLTQETMQDLADVLGAWST